jgi:hypothetical protein
LACFVFVLCSSSRPIDGALFALCITYLGASVGVLGDRSDVSVDTILRYLEKQPDVLVYVSLASSSLPCRALIDRSDGVVYFRRSNHLATILSGVGDAMVSLPFDRLARVTHLLLRLWTPSPDQILLRQRAVSRRPAKGKEKVDDAGEEGAASADLPPLEHGLTLFQLLQYVFVTRAMKRAAFVTSPPPPSSHAGLAAHEPTDWLRAIAVECKAAYDELVDRGGHPATHFVALFAAGGLLYVQRRLCVAVSVLV